MKFDIDIFVKNVAQPFLDDVQSVRFDTLHKKRELTFHEALALDHLPHKKVSHVSTEAKLYNTPALSPIDIAVFESTAQFCKQALVLQTLGLRFLELPEAELRVFRAWVMDRDTIQHHIQVLQEPISDAEAINQTNALIDYWKDLSCWATVSAPEFFYVHAKQGPIDATKKRR